MAKKKFRTVRTAKKKSRKGRMRNHARRIGGRARNMLSMLRSVSVDGPQVIDFGDPTLREAFRVWWHPYDMGEDFDEMTGSARVIVRMTHRTPRGGGGTIKTVTPDRPIMGGDTIMRHKLDPAYYRRIERAFSRPIQAVNRKTGRKVTVKPRPRPKWSSRPAPVKVVILLNYPLTAPQRKVVIIDRKYPGAIFGLTHDFYRELYAADEETGGKAGPANGGPMLNRGFGPLVWGHDLGDLGFESCRYRKFSPADAKKYGAEGEFSFGLGS